jgi:polar amino acid transport system permease protein
MSNWLQLFINSLPGFLDGARVTLELTAIGLGLGFVLGLLAALGRAYGPPWANALSVSYIELFRGTPLLVQLFLIYYGLPGLGVTIDRFPAAFLALGLNSGAYQAEYLRGALQAIGEGQMMAGRAIGMSRWKTVRFIILPQALRLVLPAWSNEPIALMKATAVVFLIAVPELMSKAKSIAARTYDPIGAYLGAALVYLVMIFILAEGIKRLDRRVRIPGFGDAEAQHGV